MDFTRDELRKIAMAVKRRFRICSSVLICGSVAIAFNAHADVKAKDAWVRGTVPAQKTTGAFLTLESSDDARVVSVRSPIAKSVEIHASDMKDGVMHMHALEALPLPAGKRVELKPGGAHVMLMGLTKPLGEGDTVPLAFIVEDSRGKRTTLEIRAPVRPLGK